ncbi:C6 transcription factor protein [Rutstroemia sp. NJR-2017a WRK4]|nr:C6 transcription factor protein [Rutstroemia sp. NJR-2017a WRK4]
MVFRGKPSRGCQRCRARRAKVGPYPSSLEIKTYLKASAKFVLGPADRYRDASELRIENESRSVARKALKNGPRIEITIMPSSTNREAREIFFAYYITSRCWEFLSPYHHYSVDAPKHLDQAIEACSSAYLWHIIPTDSTLSLAREKYVSALRLTNKAIRSPGNARKDTTLMTSLLLDLFEKITNSQPRSDILWRSHVDGALALAQARGLERFMATSDLSMLMRVGTHCIMSCIASESLPSDTLHTLQAYIESQLGAQDPSMRFSNLMMHFAEIWNKTTDGLLPRDECVSLTSGLDEEFRVFELDLPLRWQFSTFTLDHPSPRSLDLNFNVYQDSKVCHARNMICVMRILLNESLIKHAQSSPRNDDLMETAHDRIRHLTDFICASVPQYTDCGGPARSGVLLTKQEGFRKEDHTHDPNHQSSCYTLIFPLYIAARYRRELRPWVIDQLHYIGDHFRTRNAEVVAQILENGADVHTWKVFDMLGSYAVTTS